MPGSLNGVRMNKEPAKRYGNVPEPFLLSEFSKRSEIREAASARPFILGQWNRKTRHKAS